MAVDERLWHSGHSSRLRRRSRECDPLPALMELKYLEQGFEIPETSGFVVHSSAGLWFGGGVQIPPWGPCTSGTVAHSLCGALLWVCAPQGAWPCLRPGAGARPQAPAPL